MPPPPRARSPSCSSRSASPAPNSPSYYGAVSPPNQPQTADSSRAASNQSLVGGTPTERTVPYHLVDLDPATRRLLLGSNSRASIHVAPSSVGLTAISAANSRPNSTASLLGLPSPAGGARYRRNSTTAIQTGPNGAAVASISAGGMLPPAMPNSASGNFLDPNSRRRLPMVPNGRCLSPMTIRRASSPRMLPTPPPPSNPNSTPSSPHFSSASPSPPCGYVERRPSSGRRLPAEPPVAMSPSPRTPPVQQQSLPTNFGPVRQMSSVAPPKLNRPTPRIPHCLPPTPDELTSSNGNLAAPEVISPHPMTKSAPMSPRFNYVQNGEPNAMKQNSVDSVNSIPPIQRQRKFSDVRDLAMLSQNGSMAQVLEQQHILRQEFNATPDSAIVPSVSSHSSLGRSNEQLNCEKTSIEGDNPSIHGLDPSIYKTGCASNYSVGDVPANGTNGTCTTNGSASVTPSTSWPENEPRPKGLGLIHVTLQHFPVRKRLRVNVLKIEGLAGELKPELEILPFCKVGLLPGKHKQHSVVKRGRDAVFNQEFFFENVSTEDVEAKILEIEVCHQSTQKLAKDMGIGEIYVPLMDFAPQLHNKKEVRIIEELKFRTNAKKVGKISVTTQLMKEVLTVGIIKVDDLPKWGIIGAPDVCVKVKIHQESAKDANQVKQSRTIKSTCSAVFKESISFLIKTKDLDKLRVTVSVHDMSRTVTGDDVIGNVYFGPHSIDKSESEQWKNTLEHLGKEYKGNHNLKPPTNQNPDVHVSETHSDYEE